jgi:cobalt-zinc-cadmium efflux system protein
MTDKHQHKVNNNVSDLSSGKLLLSTLLNLIITITEVIGGLISNSLALFSDALHNLGDTFAVFIAYIAHLISKRKYTDRKTFGYKRIEILAALFNGIILIAVIIYLFIEAVKRLHNPEPVKGLIMMVIAVLGLSVNLFSVLLLRKDSGKNINIKAAYLHLLGDTVSSIAVIAGGLFIYYFAIYWIDPVITVLIGLYLLKETYSVLKQAVDILMQGVPEDLELGKVKMAIEQIPEIDNIHHIHAWNLNDKETHFECHIDLATDLKISETEKIRGKIHNILVNKFNIKHVTIQCEYNSCDDKNMIHST